MADRGPRLEEHRAHTGLLEKARDAAFARKGIERLISCPCGRSCRRQRLAIRDPDGYPNAPLPVIDPAAALSWFTED